ncbi:hypothetical protein GOP47_0007781 [Adiantum capillus-veneris]|uniref:Uncharacterized protein n=1 Tax=Adiantum capillus-veneris TaxID=13818 RepID=A0A9D4V2A0_ADICA|nr:hypothetical protein GOP47_0007781 [Adiantum capillus-veneris]
MALQCIVQKSKRTLVHKMQMQNKTRSSLLDRILSREAENSLTSRGKKQYSQHKSGIDRKSMMRSQKHGFGYAQRGCGKEAQGCFNQT